MVRLFVCLLLFFFSFNIYPILHLIYINTRFFFFHLLFTLYSFCLNILIFKLIHNNIYNAHFLMYQEKKGLKQIKHIIFIIIFFCVFMFNLFCV